MTADLRVVRPLPTLSGSWTRRSRCRKAVDHV